MKSCKCGCGWPVFSHGYAKYCQNKRTDDKKIKKSIPKIKITTVKDFSKKPDFGFDNQISMFEVLWNNAKDKNGIVTCHFTGERLNRFYGTELWYSCFMHILPKGKYTYWKLNPNNIAIALPDFHKIIDQGSMDDRKKHPTWAFDRYDALVLYMKEEYNRFKFENHLA